MREVPSSRPTIRLIRYSRGIQHLPALADQHAARVTDQLQQEMLVFPADDDAGFHADVADNLLENLCRLLAKRVVRYRRAGASSRCHRRPDRHGRGSHGSGSLGRRLLRSTPFGRRPLGGRPLGNTSRGCRRRGGSQ